MEAAAPLPLFIYTPKDSRLGFLAPKHTSRLLFWLEVAHSTQRLGDRPEASCSCRTSARWLILCVICHIWETYFSVLLPSVWREACRGLHLEEIACVECEQEVSEVSAGVLKGVV